MRKILLTMFAAMALLSCHNEPTPVAPDEQKAIAFGTIDTRAVESASDIDEFSVWACVSSQDDAHSVQYEPLLENEKVYRQGGNWTYDNTEYWISNSMFYFFAAYPYNIGFDEQRLEYDGEYFMLYSLNVTADGSADTEDILTAQNVTNTKNPYDTTVSLTFSHLLTKFNLTISQNTDIDSEFEYYVTKITISGLYGEALYVASPSSDGFINGFEVNEESNITLSKNYEDAPICLREDYGSGRKSKPLKVWGEDGIMLIPHEITAKGVMIRVDYLYDVNPNDSDLGQAKYVEGYIPPITWQSNTAINYNIAIANSSFISFEQPTIEPWGAPQTGGTIIIK